MYCFRIATADPARGDVVRAAAALGFHFSVEELVEANDSREHMLNDEQLDQVTGAGIEGSPIGTVGAPAQDTVFYVLDISGSQARLKLKSRG